MGLSDGWSVPTLLWFRAPQNASLCGVYVPSEQPAHRKVISRTAGESN